MHYVYVVMSILFFRIYDPTGVAGCLWLAAIAKTYHKKKRI